jgi:hypothetical protein
MCSNSKDHSFTSFIRVLYISITMSYVQKMNRHLDTLRQCTSMLDVASCVDLSTVSWGTIWSSCKKNPFAKVCIFALLRLVTPPNHSSLKSQLKHFLDFCRTYLSYISTDLAICDLQNGINQSFKVVSLP